MFRQEVFQKYVIWEDCDVLLFSI